MVEGWRSISFLAVVCFGYVCHAQKSHPWMTRPTTLEPSQPAQQTPGKFGPHHPWATRPTTLKPQPLTRPHPAQQTPGKYDPQRPWATRPTMLKPQPQTRPQPAQQTPGKFGPQRPWATRPTTLEPQTHPQPGHPVTESEPFQRCSVDDFERVQCGEPGIGAADCEAINCCFDGRLCYYGKAVTVQCTRDGQFVVVVARDATLPQLNLDSVSLLGGNDAPCSPVGTTAAFAIFQFPVTACGTFMMEEGGYVVYENRMSSSYEVGIGPLGSITRDSHYELLFQCRYSGTSVEALVVEINTVPPPPPVAAPGPLRVELRLANGQCFSKGCGEGDEAYTSYYSESDYPVTKVLRQPVYVEVHILERTDPNIVLTLGHCWATSSPDPVSVPQWDLLIDGCPYQDDRYLTSLVPVDGSSGLPYPSHYKRFILKMFTFVDPESFVPLKERVFIHCSTVVCHPTATDACEQRCHRQRRDVTLVKRDTPEDSVVVSSGEVIIAYPSQPQSEQSW